MSNRKVTYVPCYSVHIELAIFYLSLTCYLANKTYISLAVADYDYHNILILIILHVLIYYFPPLNAWVDIQPRCS